VSDIKIMLEDNSELPAEIVLRDKDLALAFRPAEDQTRQADGARTRARRDRRRCWTKCSPSAACKAAGAPMPLPWNASAPWWQKPRLFYIPGQHETATKQERRRSHAGREDAGRFLCCARST